MFHQLDAAQVVEDARPFEQLVHRAVALPRLRLTLAGVFAVFAALLTLAGALGLTWHVVETRRAELAIRLAIGASSRQVIFAVLSRSAGAALAGIAGAVAVATALLSTDINALADLGITPWPAVPVAAAAVFGVTLLGSYWPAHRSARLSPAIVLDDR